MSEGELQTHQHQQQHPTNQTDNLRNSHTSDQQVAQPQQPAELDPANQVQAQHHASAEPEKPQPEPTTTEAPSTLASLPEPTDSSDQPKPLSAQIQFFENSVYAVRAEVGCREMTSDIFISQYGDNMNSVAGKIEEQKIEITEVNKLLINPPSEQTEPVVESLSPQIQTVPPFTEKDYLPPREPDAVTTQDEVRWAILAQSETRAKVPVIQVSATGDPLPVPENPPEVNEFPLQAKEQQEEVHINEVQEQQNDKVAYQAEESNIEHKVLPVPEPAVFQQAQEGLSVKPQQEVRVILTTQIVTVQAEPPSTLAEAIAQLPATDPSPPSLQHPPEVNDFPSPHHEQQITNIDSPVQPTNVVSQVEEHDHQQQPKIGTVQHPNLQVTEKLPRKPEEEVRLIETTEVLVFEGVKESPDGETVQEIVVVREIAEVVAVAEAVGKVEGLGEGAVQEDHTQAQKPLNQQVEHSQIPHQPQQTYHQAQQQQDQPRPEGHSDSMGGNVRRSVQEPQNDTPTFVQNEVKAVAIQQIEKVTEFGVGPALAASDVLREPVTSISSEPLNEHVHEHPIAEPIDKPTHEHVYEVAPEAIHHPVARSSDIPEPQQPSTPPPHDPILQPSTFPTHQTPNKAAATPTPTTPLAQSPFTLLKQQSPIPIIFPQPISTASDLKGIVEPAESPSEHEELLENIRKHEMARRQSVEKKKMELEEMKGSARVGTTAEIRAEDTKQVNNELQRQAETVESKPSKEVTEKVEKHPEQNTTENLKTDEDAIPPKQIKRPQFVNMNNEPIAPKREKRVHESQACKCSLM